jgi:hypothetical protein
MYDIISRWNFGEFIGFTSIAGGLLVGLVAIVGGYWSGIRKKEISAALKHDMLERGMSAQDIRTVLDAGTKRSRRANAESRACCE